VNVLVTSGKNISGPHLNLFFGAMCYLGCGAPQLRKTGISAYSSPDPRYRQS
jgi:hypothetical protein